MDDFIVDPTLKWKKAEITEINESFLVLHGSYSDEYGNYKQGSVQVRSDDHNHTPVGDSKTGCIGLAYTHGKIKFSGKFGKLLNLIAN